MTAGLKHFQTPLGAGRTRQVTVRASQLGKICCWSEKSDCQLAGPSPNRQDRELEMDCHHRDSGWDEGRGREWKGWGEGSLPQSVGWEEQHT